MAKLIECVPNFSVSKEKDEAVFQALVDTANAAIAQATLPELEHLLPKDAAAAVFHHFHNEE